ncbi:MAG: TPM domain-containing protein [Gammaproteobacteria bacterium]|nr:TPM domain-containing protein [Gammaproteobacteria bacterium]
MNAGRILRHLFTGPGRARRSFPPEALADIERAIVAAEKHHAGELCFAIESALPLAEVRAGVTARERALHVFSLLRVWDTAANNGVLIYVLLADGAIELIADRAVAERIAPPEWDELCRRIETEFAAGHYRGGALMAVQAIGAQLARHFPAQRGESDELPNQPVLL